MKGLLVNLSNAKVVIYFSSVDVIGFSEYYRNITDFDRASRDYRRNFLYFYIISVLFSRSVAKQFYSQYSRYIDNTAGLILFSSEYI